MAKTSIWSDEWESLGEEPWTGGARSYALPRGLGLGASVYELAPGTTSGLYHFHHGNEELLVVLKGRPVLKTPDGERGLDEGEVVHFGLGAEAAHQVRNPTAEPVRLLIASTIVSPDAVEYPETRQLSVMAFTKSQTGAPLWDLRTLPED